MANPDARFGLKPVRHIDGSPWNGATMRCYVSASYATALYIGDPVDIDTTLSQRVAGIKCPTVIRSAFTDGTYVVGVITSFEPNPDNLTQQYRPGYQARYCNVCVDPTVVFQVRDDGGVVLAVVTIGQNAVGIFTHAGSTITGLSGMELDSGTTTAPSANASNTMIIIGAAEDDTNTWDGTVDTRVVWEVMLCNWRFLGPCSPYGQLGVTAT